MPERTTIHRAVTLATLALAAGTLCQADVIFATLPTDGAITVSPLETVGWGYSIQNQTTDYLLPIGLSNSGVLYGALSDISTIRLSIPGRPRFKHTPITLLGASVIRSGYTNTPRRRTFRSASIRPGPSC